MFDLFRFITPMPTPDPNGGVANATAGILGSEKLGLERQKMKQQADQFERDRQRMETNDAWSRQKDIVSALDKYNNILATNPEQAPIYENELRAMGVQFHPVEDHADAAKDIVTPPGSPPAATTGNPSSAHGAEEVGEPPGEPASQEKSEHVLTPDEYKAQKLTPDAVAKSIGGEEPTPPEMQQPKPQRGGKPIPAGLRTFMAGQTGAEDSAEVAPPDEIAQALKQPMSAAEYRALGPLPGMNPIQATRAPIAPSAALIPEMLKQGKMTGADVKALESAGIPLNAATPKPSAAAQPIAVHQRGPTVKAPETPEGQAASVALSAQGIRPALPKYRASFNGIDLGTFDPEAARQTLKRQATEAGAGYSQATVEKYRPLIEAIAQHARTPEEAEAMMKTFGTPEVLHLIGADAAIRAAAGRKPAGSASEDLQEYKTGIATAKDILTDQPELKDDLKSLQLLPRAISALKHPKTGMDASLAVREMMLAYNKGAFSDNDADAYMHDTSLWDKFKNLAARQEYSSIDPQMLANIATAAEHKLDLAKDSVGSAYQALVDANRYERDSPSFKRGRRLAAREVFGNTEFYKPSDWGESEPSPKEEKKGTETKSPGAPPKLQAGKAALGL